ncbi:hypothetical protein MKW98_000529 [Papaver atlanticum]|uniref:Uncharacterized protein n=1 Tax=Papaver atlanticum TaxID=357466 RepID=A0AAD4S435_9MAGN|nr:hypothetical protein MKW98_000529 [Papaver atlanticum]
MSNDFYHVVPHINSLVSFGALGEQSWGRKRYDVNPAPKEIFIKQRRKGNRETDVNPSLTMSQYLGKQAVSPIQAIESDSNLNKSITTVGVEASHSSKVADRNVGGSKKIKEKSLNCKSHCSDRSEKQANSPQELYCSDENSPLNSPLSHRSRRSIREGGSDVGVTKKIGAEVEEFLDDDGNIGGTCRKVSATLPLRRALKRHRDDSDMNDQGNVGQPRERGKDSSLMSPLGCSERGQVDRPLPEYIGPQLCPPNFLMVAGFPVLPEYKDLYTRVIASKGHMVSNAKVKSMFIQATMVTELLQTIQQMSELCGCDVTSTNLEKWRAAVDTASAMDFHVSWLDDQLHLLESQIRDVEELKATRRSLEAEVRGSGKKISLLRSKME